jgi:sugar (pentulose or hexulose) kinase
LNDPLLLAIDAGTGSCRAVLFDLDGRRLGSGSALAIIDPEKVRPRA